MACQGNNFMVLQDGTTYTFSQIFELNSETEEILADLGYRYRSAPLSLHSVEVPRLAQQLEQMRAQMRERLPFVPLTNEAAYRAFYVTPLLFAVLDQVRFKMNIEYPVTGGRLNGAGGPFAARQARTCGGRDEERGSGRRVQDVGRPDGWLE